MSCAQVSAGLRKKAPTGKVLSSVVPSHQVCLLIKEEKWYISYDVFVAHYKRNLFKMYRNGSEGPQ